MGFFVGFMLVVVDLICQWHSQLIGWNDGVSNILGNLMEFFCHWIFAKSPVNCLTVFDCSLLTRPTILVFRRCSVFVCWVTHGKKWPWG